MSFVNIPDHPDISRALRTGYATFQDEQNRDTPESRKLFVREHYLELLDWLWTERRDILDEFIEDSGRSCGIEYQDWLN